VKTKVKSLRDTFSAAEQWSNQTGEGVDSGTVEGMSESKGFNFNGF